MGEFKSLGDAVIKGDINTATAETKKSVDGGAKIQDIIDNGLIAAMDEVGDSVKGSARENETAGESVSPAVVVDSSGGCTS